MRREEKDKDFFVRPVKEEDAGSIIELLNPLIQAGSYTVMDEPVSVDEQIDFIRHFPKQGVFHVAVNHNSHTILGLQDVTPLAIDSAVFKHVGVISTFVALASTRKGIGRALSQVTFQAAKALGFIKITASVRADNPGAVSFYQSQGFRVIGTAQKHALIGGRYVDEIFMEKFID